MGGAYTKPHEVKSVQYPKLEQKIGSQAGKVMAITGCTTGTGFVAAKLAAQKGAHVVMLNRKSERAIKAKDSILAEVSGAQVTWIECDNSSFASVRNASEQLKQQFPSGIDVLCCNAGIMAMPNEAGKDGYETQMTTNHLSHFLLVKECMPLLEAAAARTGEARVIQHSSSARKHPNVPLKKEYFEKKGGDPILGDDSANLTGGRWQRYHQTKLANIVFSLELHDRLAKKGSKVKSMCAHPGLASTNLQVSTFEQGGGSGILSWLMKNMAQSGEDGACGIISCMMLPEAKSGEFWGVKGDIYGQAVSLKPEKICQDPASKKLLWEYSEQAVGQFQV